MFRALRASLLAGFLGWTGFVAAQDPVTERPTTSSSSATIAPKQDAPKQSAPKQVESPRPPKPVFDQALAVLEGREEWGNGGSLTFRVHEGGKVVMIDASQRPVTGIGRAEGNRIQFVFDNCIYEGTDANGVFAGRARYTSGREAGQSWGFRVVMR